VVFEEMMETLNQVQGDVRGGSGMAMIGFGIITVHLARAA